MKKGPNHYLLLAISLFLFSCTAKKEAPTDTTTRGDVNIVVDESLQPFFKNQIYAFQSLYPDAKIHAAFIPENEALLSLINDSSKVAVMCRDLTDEEKKQFQAENIFPISTKIAEDAIALVVNNENVDTVFTSDKIKAILLGKDSLWSQATKGASPEKITIVFDRKGSATTNYIMDYIIKNQPFSKNTFALSSSEELIDYVSAHKNAIGFMGVNWISDQDDSLTIEILKKIKVVAIAKDEHSKAVKPYQAYIKTKDYPFTRNVFMINRQTRAGLGMGFVSFVAGEKGQLMILKSGLIPAIPPTRFIEINTK